MLADDFDGDGNLDVLMNGHDFGIEVSIGRYDALNGLLLKGNGAGGFKPLSIQQSGIFIPGNGRAVVKLLGTADRYLVAVSQHKNALKLFELKRNIKAVPVNPSDVSALVRFRNGKVEKREFYLGSSFLSQSSRFMPINEAVLSVTIYDKSGSKREVQF
jgi:hypothetical protein